MYFCRAISKEKLEDFRGALSDYTNEIEIDPKASAPYFNRGIVKLTLKDKDGACLDWSKAGELGQENAYETIKIYCN